MIEHPTPKAKSMGLSRLRRRVQRLDKLLHLDSPPVVLANEVLLVLDAAQIALGTAYYDALCRRDSARLWAAAGLCLNCDSMAGIEAVNGLCEQCEAKSPGLNPDHGCLPEEE